MKKFNFAFLGGDLRYKYFYNMLLEDGFSVKSYNNAYIEQNEHSIDDLLKDTDILILPIPFSKDFKTIFNPDFEKIEIDFLIKKLAEYNVKIIASGLIPKDFSENANNIGIQVLDFFEQEYVAVLNAIPTAEGAIQTAMQESDRTIFGSKALVLGYGRCGKILAHSLKGIGAKVSVTYRSDKDYSYIEAFGFKSLRLDKIKSYISDFDFIFNTIPYCILDTDVLQNMQKNSIIIDVAQAPGGVDYTMARHLGLNAIYCPSLPGRVAPYTAGKILRDCLLEFCYIK